MPKNSLPGVLAISGDMSASIPGRAINVQFLDNISVQANASYDSVAPQGTVIISGSNDHAEYLGTVTNEGNWVELDTIPYAGIDGSFFKSLPALGVSFIQVRYTSTYGNTMDVTTTGNAAGVLNNKYFFINAVPGAFPDPTASFYVWYNSDGTGTDPMVADRTGIEVDIQDGDANTDVAQNTADAINAVSAYFGASNLGAVVTIDPVTSGGGLVVDHNTGFAITNHTTDGVLSVYVSAKAV